MSQSYSSIMRMILKRRYVVILISGLAAIGAACSGSEDAGPGDGITVVATTTMLGDIARNVVDDGGTVEVLLPIGADPHDFQPSSSQVSDIYAADLVIANGLGLEEGLSDVLAAAAADGVEILEVGGLVGPVTFDLRQPCEIESTRECDPHVWLDPERNAQTAILLGAALARADTSDEWEARAAGYAAELRESDTNIEQILSVVSQADRILVTNHDSLGYFADRYGFEVVGTVIPGGSTVSEPSSADIAELVDVINETGVSAIFAETTEQRDLADAIAGEVDHPVRVVLLYTGSLGPQDFGAETLIGMLETNATRVADGLS